MRSPIDLDVTAAQNGCVGVNGEFFCDYLYQYLLADPALGRNVDQRRDLLKGGGLTIETTLNPRFQRAADAAVRSRVNPTDQAIGGLAMVEPRTGAVRALSQSRPMGANKAKGQTYLNYVVPAKYGDANGFQAGSTFKAFTLAAAINQGIPLSTRISSPPTVTIPGERLRLCGGATLAGGDAWKVGNSTGSGTFDLYDGHPEVGEHVLRRARGAHRAVRAGHAGPRDGHHGAGAPTRSGPSRSGSPTPTRCRWPAPTRPSPPAASSASPGRSAASWPPAARCSPTTPTGASRSCLPRPRTP